MDNSARICPLAVCWPARAISRYAIVAASIGAEGVCGAYRNYGRFIAGSVNGSIDLPAVRVLAVVTGSRDHYNSRIYQGTSGTTNRIVLVRANCRRAQTHIDDANVVLVLVARVG